MVYGLGFAWEFWRQCSCSWRKESVPIRVALAEEFSSLLKRGLGSTQAFRQIPTHSVFEVPCGKHAKNYRKSPFVMGKSTINGHVQQFFVCLPEGNPTSYMHPTHSAIQICLVATSVLRSAYSLGHMLRQRSVHWSMACRFNREHNDKPVDLPSGKHTKSYWKWPLK